MVLIFKHVFSRSFLLVQDLSGEQARSQKLAAEVERLSRKLQRSEEELKTAAESLKRSQDNVETLSRTLKKSESLVNSEPSRAGESPETEDGAPRSPRSHTAGEPERELSERVMELEKEVCMCVFGRRRDVEIVAPGMLDGCRLTWATSSSAVVLFPDLLVFISAHQF